MADIFQKEVIEVEGHTVVIRWRPSMISVNVRGSEAHWEFDADAFSPDDANGIVASLLDEIEEGPNEHY